MMIQSEYDCASFALRLCQKDTDKERIFIAHREKNWFCESLRFIWFIHFINSDSFYFQFFVNRFIGDVLRTDKMATENKNTLKYVSLITLTLQNAILGLSMRYGRTRHDKNELFFSSTGKIWFPAKLFLHKHLVMIALSKLLQRS